MALPSHCQRCQQPQSAERLAYRKGAEFVRHEALLQCDLCERFACSDCLAIHDIVSGYDFLCHECARTFEAPPP